MAERKWDPPEIGSDARAHMPRSSFMDPEHRKYPYDANNPRSLRAVISRASQNGRPDLAARARKLLATYNSSHGHKTASMLRAKIAACKSADRLREIHRILGGC